MKTIIAEGASPDLAFNQQANFVLTNNATKAFSKSTDTIENFSKQYLEKNYDSAEGLGAYVILKEPKKPSTKTKYKIENVVNKTVRKWETVTNFIDEDDDIVFQIPSKETTKAKSIKKAKSIAEELGKVIKITLTKRVKVGSPVTAVVSVAKQNTDGKYFFFGIEATNLETDE